MRAGRMGALIGLFFSATGAMAAPSPVSVAEPGTRAPSTSTLPPLFGHNLNATSQTLAARQFTAGTYVLGYGLSDQLMVATSPWFAVFYNMALLDLKARLHPTSSRFDFAQELIGMKTYSGNAFTRPYDESQIFLRSIGTAAITSAWSIHANVGYQHFWQWRLPHSLRPAPYDPTPDTWSAGLLNQVEFGKGVGVLIETGGLGLNYANPYLHLGGSLHYRTPRFSIQLGLSRSIPVGPNRVYHQIWRADRGYARDPSDPSLLDPNAYYQHEAPFHPEVQIQHFF